MLIILLKLAWGSLVTKLIKKTVITLGVLGSIATITSVSASEKATEHVALNKGILSAVCFPKEENRNEGYVLSESCPIGEGLWGRKPVKQQAGGSEYWIQCGLFKKTLTKDAIEQIHRAVDAPINMKKEEGVNRCLIGPYLDYSIASKELKALQNQRLFKQSGLREVDLSTVVKSDAVAEEAIEPQPDPITIRKATIINQVHFAVPFIDNGNEGFYMENKIPWLRATAQNAQTVCQKIDMELLTKEQWKILIDSTIMTKDKWPMQLPYWGANTIGLFKDGAVRKLKNTSMLNVVCTKKTEDKVVGNPI